MHTLWFHLYESIGKAKQIYSDKEQLRGSLGWGRGIEGKRAWGRELTVSSFHYPQCLSFPNSTPSYTLHPKAKWMVWCVVTSMMEAQEAAEPMIILHRNHTWSGPSLIPLCSYEPSCIRGCLCFSCYLCWETKRQGAPEISHWAGRTAMSNEMCYLVLPQALPRRVQARNNSKVVTPPNLLLSIWAIPGVGKGLWKKGGGHTLCSLETNSLSAIRMQLQVTPSPVLLLELLSLLGHCFLSRLWIHLLL